MKIKKNILLVLVLLITKISFVFAQQDPMFNQYMFNLQTVNPGYVGTWEKIGFTALSRLQWVGFEGAPQTSLLSFQTPFTNKNVGFGVTVISNIQGLERNLAFFTDYSYRLKLSNKTNLRLGIKAGISSYKTNLFEYTLFPNNTIDPAFQGVIEEKMMPNVGVGAFLYSNRYYIGLSVPKIIQNKYDHSLNDFTTSSEIRHFFLVMGYVFNLSKNVKFKPTLCAKAVFGAPIKNDYTLSLLIKEQLWLGVSYKTGDAYGAIVQWIFNNSLRMGYAIDFPFTNLKNHQSGVHELMVSYEIDFMKKRYTSPRYF